MRLSLTDLWSSTRPSERSLHCGKDQDTRTCTIEKNIHMTLKYLNLLKKHLDHAEPRCQHFWIQQRSSRILTYFQVVRLILINETMPNLNLPNFASCVLPQTTYPFEGSSVKKILPSQRWHHQKQGKNLRKCQQWPTDQVWCILQITQDQDRRQGGYVNRKLPKGSRMI